MLPPHCTAGGGGQPPACQTQQPPLATSNKGLYTWRVTWVPHLPLHVVAQDKCGKRGCDCAQCR